MFDINHVVVSGRLTNDPKLRHTQSGKTVLNSSIAISHKGDAVSFIGFECWQKTAELINQYCKKGSQILLVGYLKQNRWQDENGKRSKIKIVVNRVMFINKQSSNEETKRYTNEVENDDSEIPF